MSVDIAFKVGRYRVHLSPPEGASWVSPLLTATQVLDQLSARGCHSTDITDALFAADPAWPHAHDAEVRRRRELELNAILDCDQEPGHLSEDGE